MAVKRFRLMPMDYDTRAQILGTVTDEAWDSQVREQHVQNQRAIREQLLYEYGVHNYEQKIADFADLGSAPFSLLAFHNIFYRQTRDAFIGGAYYPALVGACALGERILNHLILKLRDAYTATPQYKRVYNKESFDDWIVAIDTLIAWSVFDDTVGGQYKQFAKLRNRSIHFRPDVDNDPRPLALDAIRLLGEIIDMQFGTVKSYRWCIMRQGEVYIRREVEDRPFIQLVYLPHAVKVGPRHRLEISPDGWLVRDPDQDSPEDPSTDDNFLAARSAALAEWTS